MFSAITWEKFITIALLGVGAYYFISVILLYHREITAWFKAKLGTANINDEPDNAEESLLQETIVGKVRHEESALEHRTSLVDSEEIRFAERDPDEATDIIDAAGEQEILHGTIADLMQEIKTLVQLVGEYNSSKEECAALFGALFQKYPALKNTTYQQAINRHLCEDNKSQFSFDLQLLDVRSWWEA